MSLNVSRLPLGAVMVAALAEVKGHMVSHANGKLLWMALRQIWSCTINLSPLAHKRRLTSVKGSWQRDVEESLSLYLPFLPLLLSRLHCH